MAMFPDGNVRSIQRVQRRHGETERILAEFKPLTSVVLRPSYTLSYRYNSKRIPFSRLGSHHYNLNNSITEGGNKSQRVL